MNLTKEECIVLNPILKLINKLGWNNTKNKKVLGYELDKNDFNIINSQIKVANEINNGDL